MMQPVRKRPSKPFYKRAGAMAALVLTVLLTAAGLFFALQEKKSPLPPPESSASQTFMLIDKQPEELTAFEVFPPGHASYRLVRVGESFQLAENPDFALNQEMIRTMVQDLTALAAEKVGDIAKVPGGREALGLDGKHFTLRAEYADGSQRSLFFGSAAYTEIPSDYLMLSEDDGVYTVSPQVRSNLDLPLGMLHPLPRIDFSPNLLDTVRVQDREAGFSIERKADLWQVTEPLRYPADPSQVAALLGGIGGMRFAVYVGEADELRLSDYGLASPKRQVTFQLAKSLIITREEGGKAPVTREVAAQQFQYAVGNDIDGIGFYCLYQGSVYQASNASMELLSALSLDKLLARKPVVIPINQLDSLTARDAEGTRSYKVELVERIEKNNALALDEKGRPLYDPVITLGGKESDQEAFVREYLKLMDLGGQGKLPGDYAPEGGPLVQYTLKAEGMTLDLAFYPFDALHLAMSVNGSALYYVTRQAAADIGL